MRQCLLVPLPGFLQAPPESLQVVDMGTCPHGWFTEPTVPESCMALKVTGYLLGVVTPGRGPKMAPLLYDALYYSVFHDHSVLIEEISLIRMW